MRAAACRNSVLRESVPEFKLVLCTPDISFVKLFCMFLSLGHYFTQLVNYFTQLVNERYLSFKEINCKF